MQTDRRMKHTHTNYFRRVNKKIVSSTNRRRKKSTKKKKLTKYVNIVFPSLVTKRTTFENSSGFLLLFSAESDDKKNVCFRTKYARLYVNEHEIEERNQKPMKLLRKNTLHIFISLSFLVQSIQLLMNALTNTLVAMQRVDIISLSRRIIKI